MADEQLPVTQSWDWNGVIGTGRSLAVGVQAQDVTLTKQSFNNLKLALGNARVTVPPYDAGDPGLSIAALAEPIRPEATVFPSAYPFNIFGETPHPAMADQISALSRRGTGLDYVTVHMVVGENGQGIDVIGKGAAVTPTRGHAYAATLFEVSALKRLAREAGKTFGVGAVILTHGETDADNGAYESNVVRLNADYNADIRAITGQDAPIPLLLTQQQTCSGDNSATASMIAQWKIGRDHPDAIICVGPKYQYPYATDRLHLVADGYDQLGEKYAEVYYERVVLGHRWEPLQPIVARRNGRSITVNFHVPKPPLVWDDAIPAPHQTAHRAWSRGRGFEVQSERGEHPIAAVTIDGNSVLITLLDDPSATRLVVRYAATQHAVGMMGGLASGHIGQLRDSDPLIGLTTNLPLYNYAVSFALDVQ